MGDQSTDFYNDWEQRTEIEKCKRLLTLTVQFINDFEEYINYEAAMVYDKLGCLEQKIEYIEAIVDSGQSKK